MLQAALNPDETDEQKQAVYEQEGTRHVNHSPIVNCAVKYLAICAVAAPIYEVDEVINNDGGDTCIADLAGNQPCFNMSLIRFIYPPKHLSHFKVTEGE